MFVHGVHACDLRWKRAAKARTQQMSSRNSVTLRNWHVRSALPSVRVRAERANAEAILAPILGARPAPRRRPPSLPNPSTCYRAIVFTQSFLVKVFQEYKFLTFAIIMSSCNAVIVK